jgi:hypothetical protein
MAAIDKGRERRLLADAEKALEEAGYKVSRRKFKHYTIEKDGVRQEIIIRTSIDRWIGFFHDGKGWRTLGDTNIDGVVIAAYRAERDPSEVRVYPPVPRTELQSRFDQAREAYVNDGHEGARVWVCLDRRSTGKVWDTASGIVAGIEPLARYPLNPEAEPEPQAENNRSEQILPAQRSISMVVDLNEQERRRLTERYARDLEIDPRRLLVEVRLTVFR